VLFETPEVRQAGHLRANAEYPVFTPQGAASQGPQLALCWLVRSLRGVSRGGYGTPSNTTQDEESIKLVAQFITQNVFRAGIRTGSPKNQAEFDRVVEATGTSNLTGVGTRSWAR
jgi:hypothetical protein